MKRRGPVLNNRNRFSWWPIGLACSASMIDMVFRHIGLPFIHPVYTSFLMVLGIGFIGLLWQWSLQNFRNNKIEIALITITTVFIFQVPRFYPLSFNDLLILGAVVFLGFNAFRRVVETLPSWFYITGTLMVVWHGDGLPLRQLTVCLLWTSGWLLFVKVSHDRYGQLTRRIVDLAGDLTRLRVGSEWFTRSLSDTDSGRGGVAAEVDARTADAFAHFEKWWSWTVETVAPTLGLNLSAIYYFDDEQHLHLTSHWSATDRKPRWLRTITQEAPEIRYLVNDARPFFGDRKLFLRQGSNWIHQKPLDVQGYFMIPIVEDTGITAVWIGICSIPWNDTNRTLVTWLGDQIRQMADLHRSAYRHHDQIEVMKRLQEFSTRMAGTLKISDVIGHFIRVVQFVVPSDGGVLALCDADDEANVRLVWSQNIGKTPRQKRLKLPRRPDKASWTTWILQNRSEILRVELHRDQDNELPIWSNRGPQPGWNVIIGMPLWVRKHPIGIMIVGRYKDDFRTDELQWLSIISGSAALAFHNARLYEKLEYHAVRDGLTGIFNHRTFQEKLEEILKEIHSPKSTFKKVALLILDLDHFKKINDTYGHPFGDLILKKTTSAIQHHVRHYDVVARYGGEEFAVILPGCDEDSATQVAEQIRAGVADIKAHKGLDSIQVTASIGVACYPADARSRTELIERADAALYHAKRSGRNQVWHWRDLPVESFQPETKSQPLSLWRRILHRFTTD